MKKLIIATAAAAVSTSLFAGLYGDTPDAKHAWAVHDWNRPKPVKVEPGATCGQPPSDAIVLFDGTAESLAKNWCDRKGEPTKWKLGTEGDFYCAPGYKNGGNIYTRGSFGDCQLHLEYRHEADVTGDNPQMRGNSGVFIMGNYEIQVLESYYTRRDDCKVDNYADGQAGAVYAENPPMVNPQRKPGEWQTYDIVFHQPVWEGDKLVHPGSVTVFFNGVLVQDHWEMEGLTTHCRRRPLAPHATKAPLSFQDHGCTVHFRNIWLREIPSRWANTTHATLSAKEGDVMVQRYKTACGLLAKIDQTKCGAQQVNQAYEVISYSKDPSVLEPCRKIFAGYLAQLNALDDKALDAKKGEIMGLKRSVDVLKRNKVVANCALCDKILAIVEKKGWNKKR